MQQGGLGLVTWWWSWVVSRMNGRVIILTVGEGDNGVDDFPQFGVEIYFRTIQWTCLSPSRLEQQFCINLGSYFLLGENMSREARLSWHIWWYILLWNLPTCFILHTFILHTSYCMWFWLIEPHCTICFDIALQRKNTQKAPRSWATASVAKLL